MNYSEYAFYQSNNISNNSSVKISENNNNDNDGCIYLFFIITYFLTQINNGGQNYLRKAKLTLKRLRPLSLIQILIESFIIIIYTIYIELKQSIKNDIFYLC